MTIEERQKQREYEKILVLSSVRKGRVLFKDVIKKTGWSKQKVVALCHWLVRDGILEEKNYCVFSNKVKGFYVKGY